MKTRVEVGEWFWNALSSVGFEPSNASSWRVAINTHEASLAQRLAVQPGS